MPERIRCSRIALLLLVCLVFISLISIGCKPAQEAASEKVLTYAINTDITSLDPVRVTEDNPRIISTQLLEGLVGYDGNLQLRPVLAESWTPSIDGREWRFKLRQNVFFHEDPCFGGKPRTVTSSDVVYSLQRMLDAKTQTLGAFILTDVVEGAADFNAGKANSVLGIVAEAPDTVLFKLTKPYAQFPARLSLPFAAIIPQEAVTHYGEQWGRHPVGTGPFKFKAWDVTTGQIALERNPKYWRQIATNLTGIKFAISKAEATQLADFAQGKTDALEITPAIANQVIDKEGKPTGRFAEARLIQKPILTVHFIGFNLTNPLLRDKNFRLACNYAVNKDELTKMVLDGLAKPANGPLAPSLPGTDSTPLYPQDMQKAKDLLNKSSYKGKGLVYTTDNSAKSVAVAEFLQSQLDAVGVKIRIDKNPESVWVDKLTKGQFDLGKLYFSFDYPSPDNGFSQFLKANFAPAGPNFLHYENKEFDHLYDEALQQADITKATEIFAKMNTIVREDAPWIFLYYPTRTIVVRKGVEGMKVNALSFSLILEDVKL
jgi:oligopeptide transport system substrate-binding protein